MSWENCLWSEKIYREHDKGPYVTKVSSFGKEIIYLSQNTLRKCFNKDSHMINTAVGEIYMTPYLYIHIYNTHIYIPYVYLYAFEWNINMCVYTLHMYTCIFIMSYISHQLQCLWCKIQIPFKYICLHTHIYIYLVESVLCPLKVVEKILDFVWLISTTETKE